MATNILYKSAVIDILQKREMLSLLHYMNAHPMCPLCHVLYDWVGKSKARNERLIEAERYGLIDISDGVVTLSPEGHDMLKCISQMSEDMTASMSRADSKAYIGLMNYSGPLLCDRNIARDMSDRMAVIEIISDKGSEGLQVLTDELLQFGKMKMRCTSSLPDGTGTAILLDSLKSHIPWIIRVALYKEYSGVSCVILTIKESAFPKDEGFALSEAKRYICPIDGLYRIFRNKTII